MMMRSKKLYIFLLLLQSTTSLVCRDIILEFKGAYFLPTNHTFRHAFHNGGALFGPELTVQLCSDDPWYAFLSIDYFQKKGHRLGLCDSTKLRLLPLAAGLKYMAPVANCVDLYLGLGFQPVYMHTSNKRGCVTAKASHWAFGGIGKLGAYVYLERNFVLDFFFDYSFVTTKRNNFYGYTVTPSRTHIGGAIFGLGLGYVF